MFARQTLQAHSLDQDQWSDQVVTLPIQGVTHLKTKSQIIFFFYYTIKISCFSHADPLFMSRVLPCIPALSSCVDMWILKTYNPVS